jgi:hypothetical protein
MSLENGEIAVSIDTLLESSLSADDMVKVREYMKNERFKQELRSFLMDVHMIHAKNMAAQQKLMSDSIIALLNPSRIPELIHSWGPVYEDRVRAMSLMCKGISVRNLI